MSAGRLILMGSGEMAARLVAAHRLGIEASRAREVVVLDTPYGFQENAPLLSEKLTRFFRTSLSVEASVASYRSVRDGDVTCERMLAAVRRARYVFAGPGSPSYALGVWRETGLAGVLRGILAGGATVTLASAAALTAGVKTLPVYEIYKSGADPGWLDGMDLTSHLGLEAVVIPHWNNAEGQGFDTSRCYMGRRRLRALRSMLPEGLGVIGVDEHTAAVIDFGKEELSVMGVGGVTLSGALDTFLEAGTRMGLKQVVELLGTSPALPSAGRSGSLPDFAGALAERSVESIAGVLLSVETEAAGGSPEAREALRTMILEISEVAVSGLITPAEWVGDYVQLLVDVRAALRERRVWEEADRIRDGLASLGIALRDTRSGTTWHMEG